VTAHWSNEGRNSQHRTMRFSIFLLCPLVGVQGWPHDQLFGGMAFQEDFSPRYYLGDPGQALSKRDTCNAGTHSCKSISSHRAIASVLLASPPTRSSLPGRDVGFPDFCCKNDRFCIVLRNGTASCCPVERECIVSDEQPCPPTAYFCRTPTVTVVDGTTATSTLEACCPRACTAAQSSYRCGDEFGGGCCAFNSQCATSNQCISTKTELPPIVTPADPGCTTSQHRCPDGFGCCDDGRECTVSGTVKGCVASLPSGSGVAAITTKSEGLSAGAKAGIAVGVVIGVGAAVALLTWICLAKRKGRSLTQRNSGTGGDNATDITSASRPPRRIGVPIDDLPSPVVGPFSHGPPAMATPDGAVPHQPHHPDDIAVPIEMPAGLGLMSSGSDETPAWRTPGESPGQVYELYGSTTASPPTSGTSPLNYSWASPFVPSPSENGTTNNSNNDDNHQHQQHPSPP
jgi:hypothetical protein